MKTFAPVVALAGLAVAQDAGSSIISSAISQLSFGTSAVPMTMGGPVYESILSQAQSGYTALSSAFLADPSMSSQYGPLLSQYVSELTAYGGSVAPASAAASSAMSSASMTGSEASSAASSSATAAQSSAASAVSSLSSAVASATSSGVLSGAPVSSSAAGSAAGSATSAAGADAFRASAMGAIGAGLLGLAAYL